MIILDTNFIVYIMKYRIAHILEEHKSELAVPSPVIEELMKIEKKAEKPADRDAAKLALLIIRKWGMKILEAGGNADDAIAELAEKNKAKVATMDKILTSRLKKSGVSVLKIRQKKHLILS